MALTQKEINQIDVEELDPQAGDLLPLDVDQGAGVYLTRKVDVGSLPQATIFSRRANGLYNVSISASVGSNAMTIRLRQRDGATNPATGSGKLVITFRSATITSGALVDRTVTAPLSTVISSGSTAGFTNAIEGDIFVYAIDNAGTVELGWSSGSVLNESILHSSTAEGGAGGADSQNVLYSTTARSNVAIRFIGVVTSTQATAGTWATAPSKITAAAPFIAFFASRTTNFWAFTASGASTWTCPKTGWYEFDVFGGGGSGGGVQATAVASIAVSSSGNTGNRLKGRRWCVKGEVLYLTIGAGGASPTAGANPGNAGGNSLIGTSSPGSSEICTVVGGAGGASASAGNNTHLVADLPPDNSANTVNASFVVEANHRGPRGFQGLIYSDLTDRRAMRSFGQSHTSGVRSSNVTGPGSVSNGAGNLSDASPGFGGGGAAALEDATAATGAAGMGGAIFIKAAV